MGASRYACTDGERYVRVRSRFQPWRLAVPPLGPLESGPLVRLSAHLDGFEASRRLIVSFMTTKIAIGKGAFSDRVTYIFEVHAHLTVFSMQSSLPALIACFQHTSTSSHLIGK